MSPPLLVLYDGWSLVYAPNSPAALHLLTVLAAASAEIRPVVALPGEPPVWFRAETSVAEISIHIHRVTDGPWNRLRWEQRGLPRLARELDARLLHLFSPTAALFGAPTTVVSPAEAVERGAAGEERPFTGRLREALSGGGMARARALLWPADLPAAGGEVSGAPVLALPPAVHPLFSRLSGLPGNGRPDPDLPESYVLYHGPQSQADLRRVLEIWTWAAGPLGDQFPLLLAGLDESARRRLEALLPAFNLEENVRSLPALPPAGLAALYRRAAALLHPAPLTPWGNPVRLALALGKPVVAADTALTGALVGPAAYLAPLEPGGRALGAALLTVIVEEELGASLSQAAAHRSSAWELENFKTALLEVYRKLDIKPLRKKE